jgi:energy-coupling factor transporter ATP-binding protein EcfA2
MTRTGESSSALDSWSGSIRCPGLSVKAEVLAGLVEEVSKRWAVLQYEGPAPGIWIVFIGGTGTGKSTVFNTLCGLPLSRTGIERPKTRGPIAYAFRGVCREKGFPIPGVTVRKSLPEAAEGNRLTGRPGEILIVEHDRKEMAHWILVDTPDLDSLEREHRQMADDLYLLSDVVVFVTSQEKYADGVPYEFLQTVQKDRKPFFFILNKAGVEINPEEISAVLEAHGIRMPPDRFRLFSYLSSAPPEVLPEGGDFQGFAAAFSRTLSPAAMPHVLKAERAQKAHVLRERLDRLLAGLQKEEEASEKWASELERHFQDSCEAFLRGQQEKFSVESRAYLQPEIRHLFAKYDLLARPRRMVTRVLAAPLRLFGIGKRPDTRMARQEALARLREKVDLSPVNRMLDRFNRKVLEHLSPADPASPLALALRRPGILITEEEVKERVWKEQERLLAWLQETFEQLARGIPRHKEWGIYSTSVLWGVFILSLEAAIGGGLGILDAAVDSLLAPFVTKGAAELFAYGELQKIARDLAERYQKGLLAVMEEQRDRYRGSLGSLRTPEKTMAHLAELRKAVSRMEKG